MEKDDISTAFDLMVGAIKDSIDKIAKDIHTASNQKDFQRSEQLSRGGEPLKAFLKKVEILQKEWNRDFDKALRGRVRAPRGQAPDKPRKASRQRLCITFPDGERINGSQSAHSFAQAIAKLGVEAVKALDLKVCNVPLIDAQRDEKYGSSQRECGSYFVMTHSSTEAKKELLETIAERLGVSLQVELLPKDAP